MEERRTLINISRKTFLQVTVLLLVLMLAAAVLTYIVPKGRFGMNEDGTYDYSSYQETEEIKGIPVYKGLLAPFLVFASDDGLTLIMLSLFLLVISSAFQVMDDTGGIKALVSQVSSVFKGNRYLFVSAVSLLFMCFGAFLGLFEEMLTMLPIAAALSVTMGFDRFTGFLISIVSCGFGFATAVTNPFTVLLASEIIGADPVAGIWFRLVIFAVMYLVLQIFIRLYIRKIEKDPAASLTGAVATGDNSGIKEDGPAEKDKKRLTLTYGIFLTLSLIIIVVCSFLPSVRSYSVVILTAYFLIMGILAGVISGAPLKNVMKSFLRGITGALPTIVFIALAASVKYIFEEGMIMPTIVSAINRAATGRDPFKIAIMIYAVVLVLEFFISSSTAKAILIMGILKAVEIGLTKNMSVLIYTFADGYTNVLFPTSPVLMIGLSMIGVDYFRWVKKSLPLFLVTLILVIGFLLLGITIGY